MAWDDPSPRAHARAVRAGSQPGYGAQPLSSGRLIFRLVLAVAAGVIACAVARGALGAWRGHAGQPSGLATALALAIGFVAGALAWRYVTNRPASIGLSARIRDGGGWGRVRDRDDALDLLIAADVIADLIEVTVDIATDL